MNALGRLVRTPWEWTLNVLSRWSAVVERYISDYALDYGVDHSAYPMLWSHYNGSAPVPFATHLLQFQVKFPKAYDQEFPLRTTSDENAEFALIALRSRRSDGIVAIVFFGDEPITSELQAVAERFAQIWTPMLTVVLRCAARRLRWAILNQAGSGFVKSCHDEGPAWIEVDTDPVPMDDRWEAFCGVVPEYGRLIRFAAKHLARYKPTSRHCSLPLLDSAR